MGAPPPYPRPPACGQKPDSLVYFITKFFSRPPLFQPLIANKYDENYDANLDFCFSLYKKLKESDRKYINILYQKCKTKRKDGSIFVDYDVNLLTKTVTKKYMAEKETDSDDTSAASHGIDKSFWLILNVLLSSAKLRINDNLANIIATNLKDYVGKEAQENLQISRDIINSCGSVFDTKTELLNKLISINCRSLVPNLISTIETQMINSNNSDFFENFLSECEKSVDSALQKLILNKLGKNVKKFEHEDEIVQNILLGCEIYLRQPEKVSPILVLCVRILIMQGTIIDSNLANTSNIMNLGESLHQVTGISFHQMAENCNETGEGNTTAVPGSLLAENSNGDFEPKQIASIPACSLSLKALAITCLGKLCIQQHTLVNEVVAVIGYELKYSNSAIIRNNCLLVLSDITLVKTQHVTPYITVMTNCLLDKVEMVRWTAVVVLSKLMQQEYIKWSENIFYKYLSALLDHNKEINQIAKYTLIDMLENKVPDMFERYMVECIYYLNCYMEDSVHNKYGRTENKVYQPNYSDAQRLKLYKFILTHMSDAEKFNLQSTICHEVLLKIFNKCEHENFMNSLDLPAQNMIKDVMEILLSEEIKLDVTKKLRGEIADADTAALTEAVDLPGRAGGGANSTANNANAISNTMAANKLKITLGGITYAQKVEAVEAILPAVLSILKLLKKFEIFDIFRICIRYLNEFKKNNKKEYEEVLKTDTQQKLELDHMIKIYEKMEERKKKLLELERIENERSSKDNRGRPVLSEKPLGNQTFNHQENIANQSGVSHAGNASKIEVVAIKTRDSQVPETNSEDKENSFVEPPSKFVKKETV